MTRPRQPPVPLVLVLLVLPLFSLYRLFVGGLGWTLGALSGWAVAGMPGLVGGGILGLTLFGAGMAAATAGRPPLWLSLAWLGASLCGGASCAAPCALLLLPGGGTIAVGWLLGAVAGLPAGLLGVLFCHPDRSALGLGWLGGLSGLLAGLLGTLLGGIGGWAVAGAAALVLFEGLLAWSRTGEGEAPPPTAGRRLGWVCYQGLAGLLAGAAGGWLGQQLVRHAEQFPPGPLRIGANVELAVDPPALQLLLRVGFVPLVLLGLWLAGVLITGWRRRRADSPGRVPAPQPETSAEGTRGAPP